MAVDAVAVSATRARPRHEGREIALTFSIEPDVAGGSALQGDANIARMGRPNAKVGSAVRLYLRANREASLILTHP
jgi:hypothetical protein